MQYNAIIYTVVMCHIIVPTHIDKGTLFNRIDSI